MDLKMMWIGQAGFIIKTKEGSFAVDPYCGVPPDGSRRLYDPVIPKGETEVDFVISTHSHWDHFDITTYRDYVIPKALIGPRSCIKMLNQSEIRNHVEGIEIDIRDSIKRRGFTVTAVYANHDRDSIGVVVDCNGLSLYFSGDTLFDLRLLSIKNYKPDIMCVCINGKFGNMSYYEAAVLCSMVKPRLAIPTHYDMIEHNTENPRNFVNALKNLDKDINVFVPEKGIEYDVSMLLK